MKNYCILTLLVVFLLQSVSGQITEIAFQGFEGSDTWEINQFSSPPCTIGDDSWNYHNSLGEISPYSSDYFWGITDLNGNCGSSGFESIEFKTVDLSDYHEVELSFYVNVQGFDNGDDMKYQLWFDQIMQPEQIFIDGTDNYSTSGWKEIKIPIDNSVRELKFIIMIRQNGSDQAGLDHFALRGIPVADCSEILISEYAEGTSSNSHRNNYIELYNPSSNPIDLSAYSLAKFTGKNLSPSSQLQLSGQIFQHQTYLIEDKDEILNIKADLSSNSSVIDFNGDDKVALLKNGQIVDLIGDIGDSLFFAKDLTLQRKSEIQHPNSQFNIDEWESYPLEHVNNLNSHSSTCQGPLPEIEVLSNNYLIKDGDQHTSLLNNTYLGSLAQTQETPIVKSFTIKNSGTSDLQIENILFSGEHADSFTTNLDSEQIRPGDSLEFHISFSHTELGVKTAQVQIINNDPSENKFSFIIQAEITGRSYSPLIISQYYEGLANDKWIEITNTSASQTIANSFFVCIYRNEAVYSPIGKKPSAKKEIPALDPGESILFRASLNVSEPLYALSQPSVKTSVCSFSGDDILIISASDAEKCWQDRTDLVGRTGNWGTNLSLVRKTGCLSTGSNTGFDMLDWNIHSVEQINQAQSGSTNRLGEHYIGETVWINSSWQNGLPSLERNVVIADAYSTQLHGEVKACNLLIRTGAQCRVDPEQHITVKNDLIVDGLLEIKDQASLIMLNNEGKVSNSGQIIVRKIARNLKPTDYIYWSSPIKTAELESVFEQSPQHSFYTFSTSDFIDLDHDGQDDDQNAWQRVFGAMEVARGYTALAPNNSHSNTDYQVEFNGEVNSGLIEISLDLQNENYNSNNDWNLIGNPYPSSIDIHALYFHPENKDRLKGTFYFWTHNSSPVVGQNLQSTYSSDDYAMYTIGTGGIRAQSGGKIPTQYVSSCQGFFIEAEKSGPLTFDNNMRIHQESSVFYKQDNKDPEAKIWLDLYNDQGAYSQILIGFVEGATEGIDLLYDGQRLPGNDYLSFFSQVDKTQLAIRGDPPFTGKESINLGFVNSIEEPVTLRIGIDQISPLLKNNSEGIFLYDRNTTRYHDLLERDYQFTTSRQGSVTDRFQLSFKKPAPELLNTDENIKQIHWYSQNDVLFVKSLNQNKIKAVQLYDLNGRLVRNREVDSHDTHLFWAGLATRAIYLLKVNFENDESITKRIVHW